MNEKWQRLELFQENCFSFIVKLVATKLSSQLELNEFTTKCSLHCYVIACAKCAQKSFISTETIFISCFVKRQRKLDFNNILVAAECTILIYFIRDYRRWLNPLFNWIMFTDNCHFKAHGMMFKVKDFYASRAKVLIKNFSIVFLFISSKK